MVTLQSCFLSLLLCGYFTDLLSVLASLWLLYRPAFCPCFSVVTLQTCFLSLLLCGYFTDLLSVLASLWLLHRPSFCPCFPVVTLQTFFLSLLPCVTLQTGFLSLCCWSFFLCLNSRLRPRVLVISIDKCSVT